MPLLIIIPQIAITILPFIIGMKIPKMKGKEAIMRQTMMTLIVGMLPGDYIPFIDEIFSIIMAATGLFMAYKSGDKEISKESIVNLKNRAQNISNVKDKNDFIYNEMDNLVNKVKEYRSKKKVDDQEIINENEDIIVVEDKETSTEWK